MRNLHVLLLFLLVNSLAFTQDSIPAKNREILDYVTKHGREISPTYESAVCTELVIGVLKNFISLTSEDKSNIRIIISEDVYELMAKGSLCQKVFIMPCFQTMKELL